MADRISEDSTVASLSEREILAERPRDYLRRDLGALVDYSGQPSLRAAFLSLGIRRVLEVGTGLEFEAIQQLAGLQTSEEEPFFKPEDLWAVDPEIWTDERLACLQRVKPFFKRFSRGSALAQEVARQIKEGCPPFDLVFSKGVASIGGLLRGDETIEQTRENGLAIIAAMGECLNPANPHALLLACTKSDSILPFCQGDLEDLGLAIVYAEEVQGQTAKDWIEVLQRAKIFPPSGETFSNLVICKRSQA